MLRKSVKQGDIMHIGRNKYAFPNKKRLYRHAYSDIALNIVREIQNEYEYASFQVYELTGLNLFVNHQIAHNTIMVYVENDLVDYVFDSLRTTHPGQVMLKPRAEEYYRYHVENQIVIERLPSESPKEAIEPWRCRMEKILVDIVVDKLLSQIVPAGEQERILREASLQFILDRSAMSRYARRKGAEEKFKKAWDKCVAVGGV